jgi:hypothetical protein
MIDAVDQAIEVLNRINETDPSVLPRLISHRVSCNLDLAKDKTVQVGKVTGQILTYYEVGLLGIINGLFGIQEDGFGYITCNLDDYGTIINFTRHEVNNGNPDS